MGAAVALRSAIACPLDVPAPAAAAAVDDATGADGSALAFDDLWNDGDPAAAAHASFLMVCCLHP